MTDKTVMKNVNLENKFSRSWHEMPIHEKSIMLRQASLSHTIVFHVLTFLCTLKTAYKYDDKKYQDIRGNCYNN